MGFKVAPKTIFGYSAQGLYKFGSYEVSQVIYADMRGEARRIHAEQ